MGVYGEDMTSVSSRATNVSDGVSRALPDDLPAIFPKRLVYRTVFGLAAAALVFSSGITWLQGATSGNLPYLLLATVLVLVMWFGLERFGRVPRWFELGIFGMLVGVFFGYFARTISGIYGVDVSSITTSLVVRKIDWYIWTPLLYVLTHLLFDQHKALRWSGFFFVVNTLIGLSGFWVIAQQGLWQDALLTQVATFVDFQLVSLIFIGLTHYLRRSAEAVLATEHDDRRRANIHYQMMFENTPVALWEEDLSAVYEALQQMQDAGVNLAEHLRDSAELDRLFKLIRVRHANQLAQEYWTSLTDNAPSDYAYNVSEHDRYMWYLGLLSIVQGHRYFRVSDALLVNPYVDKYGVRFEPHEVTSDVSWQVLESDVPFARVLVSRVNLAPVRQAEAERDKQGRLLDTIINSLPDYVLAVDLDRRITLANNAAAKALDMTRQQMIGKRYHEVLPTHIVDALEEDDDEVFAGAPIIGRERNFAGTYLLTNRIPLFSKQKQVIGAVIASRDITELKENEEAVRRSEAMLVRAQRLAKIGNWRVNTRTEQLEWSEETFRIFGRKRSAGMPTLEEYYQYLPEEDHAKARKAMRDAIVYQQPYDVDHAIIHREGHLVHVHSRRERAEVASDGTVFLYGTIQDISDRKALEAALNDRNNSLEAAVEHAREANRAREMFVANITHELRTPLNTIRGFAQLLQLEEITPDKLGDAEFVISLIDALKRIRNASDLLNGLVDELVLMASVRQNPEGLHLDAEDIAVVRLVRETCNMVMPQARMQGVRLHIDVPPVEVRPFVRTDPRKLQQIILNLLTNAIKYNQQGGNVWTRVSCHGDKVSIAVQDDGRGMSTEQRERLFVPFERLGIQATDIPGRGLGLALAKTYADAMQIEITVTSEPGKGSHFGLIVQRVAPPDDVS